MPSNRPLSRRLARPIIDFSFRQSPFAYNIFLLHTFGAGRFPTGSGRLFGGSQRKMGRRQRARTLDKPVAGSTTSARKPVAKSTSCAGKIRRQVHHCHRGAFAPDTEVFREARRGRSRRPGGSRKPKSRLCEGTTLARLRPRAPRTRLLPDGSCLADLGRACAGGSRPTESPRNGRESHCDSLSDFRPARAVPHTARPSPGLAAERVRLRPNGRRNTTPPLRPPTPAGRFSRRRYLARRFLYTH